jgi:hypothetical protein
MTPEDQGIHKTQVDVWEAELKQAGWTPTAAHPHSPVWRDPQGVLHPGVGYSWLVMKERAAKDASKV